MMIIVNGFLAGTFALAAARLLSRRRQRNLMYWLVVTEQTPFETEDRDRLAAIDQSVEITYRYASYSLGLTILGIAYPPFGLLSVPLMLFSALPLFERTLDNATNHFEVNSDVFATTVISVSLVLENYFFASLLQWLLALNEKAAFRFSERMKRYFDPNTSNVDWAAFFDLLQAQWRVNGDTITLDASHVRRSGETPDKGDQTPEDRR